MPVPPCVKIRSPSIVGVARGPMSPRLPCEVGRVEARLVGVRPHRLARVDAIASDELVLAALLLRHGVVADDRKRRPAAADFAPPQFLRRMRLPIGFQFDAVDLGPIAVAQKPRIVARRRLPIVRLACAIRAAAAI